MKKTDNAIRYRATLEKGGSTIDMNIYASSLWDAYQQVEHQCDFGWKITNIRPSNQSKGNTPKASIEFGKLIELTQQKLREQWPEIMRNYEDDTILQHYCDWCNIRMKDYGADVVRPTRITTFRVWLHYNYPAYEARVDELFERFQRNTEII